MFKILMKLTNWGILLFFILTMSLAFSCGPSKSLELTIYYPLDGSTLRTNLIKVIGEISNPAATVTINGSDGSTSNNGRFSTYMDLEEGKNVIKIVASLNNRAVEKTIDVTFTPAVSIKLSSHELMDNSIFVHGHVFPPQASVEVNRISVALDGQGIFSYKRELVEGYNAISVEAEYAGSKDMDTIRINVENGVPSFIPPENFATTKIVCDNEISVTTGQSAVMVITDSVGKEMQSAGEHTILFAPVSGEDNIDAGLLPAGMNLDIASPQFKVYPDTPYQIEMKIQTSNDIKTGSYWIVLYEASNKESSDFRCWVKINVLNQGDISNITMQPPWTNYRVYTDATQPIFVNTGDEFTIGFPVNFDLYPIIDEDFDDKKVALIKSIKNSYDTTKGNDQHPIYCWYLFKTLEAGVTPITVSQSTHLIQSLENQKTFTVVIR